MNKKYQVITTLIGIIFTISILFFFIIQLQTPADTYGMFEPILGVKVFNTSTKHNEFLGVETAKISKEDIKKLNGIIEKVIRAQEEYNSTRKEESLEKIKGLYLPEVFEAHKEEFNRISNLYPKGANDSTETLKYSSPRIYKNLSDRIGILSLVDFSFSQYLDAWPRGILQIFIFKNINGDWKIEKQEASEGMAEQIREELEATETKLVKQILDKQK